MDYQYTPYSMTRMDLNNNSNNEKTVKRVVDRDIDMAYEILLFPYDEVTKSKSNTRKERRFLRRASRKCKANVTRILFALEIDVIAYYRGDELVGTRIKNEHNIYG